MTLICTKCIPWTFPLNWPARQSDGAVRLMNYQEHLAYAWHLQHQIPHGEIDVYTKELLDQPKPVA